jgi:AraC family transcriptional regulator
MVNIDTSYRLRPAVNIVGPERRLTSAERHRVAVDRVVAFMRGNVAEPLTLNELADVAHCSPWHFDRIFSGVTGLSPLRYLSHLRIEAAKLAVMHSDRRIIDIAYDVGYNSLGSFGKRFTELVGLSPRELRKAADKFDVTRWRSGLDHICAASDGPAPSFAPAIRGHIAYEAQPLRAGWAMIAAMTANDSILKPSACALVAVPGPFTLRGLAPGSYALAAIAFDRAMASGDVLAQQSAARGRVGHVTVGSGADESPRLMLHAPEASDAPIVPPYAILAERTLRAGLS